MPDLKADVLIIGGGLAGLEAAWAVVNAGKKPVIVTKGAAASPAVLGFNAAVSDADSVERFAKDTYKGGWELGEPVLVRVFAEESSETVPHMESLGMTFEQKEKGEYHLLQPLGCSVPRLVHHRNITGQKSMEVLRNWLFDRGVVIQEHTMAAQLIKHEGRVCGATCLDLDGGEPFIITAGAVVLATGGASVMKNSTYPLCQTADGYAMAWEAGAVLQDMEFVQHEPCRAVWPKLLGISTTLLAKGGRLTNRLGERFLLKHYPSEGAVPKDLLARLIAVEVKEGRGSEHGGVYLDLTELPEEEIKVNHVLYYDRFMNAGIDLTKEIVEVGPAAHSIMGGVRITPDGYTGVPGLYAAGEVIGGLHGANRLGGNAGAEVYVFGRRAGAAAARECVQIPEVNSAEAMRLFAYDEKAAETNWEAAKEAVRLVIAKAAAPVRNEETLAEALEKLIDMMKAFEASVPNSLTAVRLRLEALHLCRTAIFIAEGALNRRESRGVHYREDYPAIDNDKWKKHIRFQKDAGMTLGE